MLSSMEDTQLRIAQKAQIERLKVQLQATDPIDKETINVLIDEIEQLSTQAYDPSF